MADTKIEWADAVWNPVTGCTPISEGCQNCYAERMAKRLAGRCGYPADKPFRLTLHPERLADPLRWKKPRRVFVNSMGDLFHEDVPFDFIIRVWTTMMLVACLQHTFLILTKRPERMLEFYQWVQDRIKRGIFGVEFERDNIWLGVTAENQEQADKRIPILLQIPAAVRFVSVEPMLGEVDLIRVNLGGNAWLNSLTGKCTVYHPYGGAKTVKKSRGKLDWVICGGESGPGARPMHPDWVRSLLDQCQAAGVPFFFKQWGEFIQCDYRGNDFGASYIDSQCIDGKLQDLDKCDDDGNLYSIGYNPTCPKCKGRGYLRVGKKKSGRLLNGKEWNEIPSRWDKTDG